MIRILLLIVSLIILLQSCGDAPLGPKIEPVSILHHLHPVIVVNNTYLTQYIYYNAQLELCYTTNHVWEVVYMSNHRKFYTMPPNETTRFITLNLK